jgi:urease accessory protein
MGLTDKDRWHGNLELVYTHRQNATRITHSLSQAPLKIQRPFYPEGKEICHSIILHTAGGIVGSDLLDQKIHLQANANATITTAAAGKIYRSNGNVARQKIDISLDPQATLEWLPQETIVFSGAKYQQDLRIELASTAHFLAWDITRFGRTAKGERFIDGEWRSNTEIWRDSKPLWIDRQFLQGSEINCNSLNALAGCAIVASLIYIGQPVNKDIITQARFLWSDKGYAGEAGVTQTLGDGLLCRYRGNSTSNVRHWFTDVWDLLRSQLLNRSTIKPRVW